MSNAPAAVTVSIDILLLILAGMAAVAARGGWTGSLRREGKLGIHSPAATASDEAFALANKVAAPVLAGATAVGVAFAGLVLVLPIPTVLTVVVGLMGLIGSAVLVIAAGLLGEKAARTMPVPARRPQPGGVCDGCACGSGGCSGLTRTAAPGDASAAPVTAPAAAAGAAADLR